MTYQQMDTEMRVFAALALLYVAWLWITLVRDFRAGLARGLGPGLLLRIIRPDLEDSIFERSDEPFAFWCWTMAKIALLTFLTLVASMLLTAQ